MAIGTAATVVSIAATAAGAGMSFRQANKQKKFYEKYQEDAAKSMVEAKKIIDVNYLESLSIPTQAYEMEKDILQAASAQALEAGREGDQRGVAATAGRVQAATADAARGIRADMSGELYDLNKLTQEENRNIATKLANLNLAEVEGAQLAARDAQEARAAAMTQGFKSVASLSGQLVGAANLYGKSDQAKLLGGITKDYEQALKSGQLGADYLNPDSTTMTAQQAIAKAGGFGPEVAGLSEDQFQDYITKLPMDKLQALFYNKSFTDNLSPYERTLQNNLKYQFDEPFAAPVNSVTTPN
jgi:hypothetical protein